MTAIAEPYKLKIENLKFNTLEKAWIKVIREEALKEALNKAIAIFSKLPQGEMMTKFPVILELKILRDKLLGVGKR